MSNESPSSATQADELAQKIESGEKASVKLQKKQFKDKIQNITTGYRGVLIDDYNF